jgi:signal transduction histidine kinase
MPAHDFDAWNARTHRWQGDQAEAARAAWLAAEARLLDPIDRPLAEVIALEILKGDHACLDVLVDWLTEQGRVEPAFRQRLVRLQTEQREHGHVLAAGLAYDFNNLLTVVLGYAEILVGELPADHPGLEMARAIEQAGRHGANLCRQVLALCRRPVPATEVLDLNAVVEDMARLLPRLLGPDVELVQHLDPARPHVRIDRRQLDQVILNLAINAGESMPRGGRLTFQTGTAEVGEEHPDFTPGPYTLLRVIDTGTGIAAEVLPRIFEPFFTTKGPGRHAGLGLSTVQSILRAASGYIEVESRVDEGTRFTIYLPRVSQPGPVPGDTSPIAPGSETVLVVMPDDALRSITGHILQGHGYRVLDAASADAALQAAEQLMEKLDLVVTDLVLPEHGGPELADRLTARHPGARILYLTGYGDELVPTGASLQKPFTPLALARRVRAVLDGEN